jgi:hypothetical protein
MRTAAASPLTELVDSAIIDGACLAVIACPSLGSQEIIGACYVGVAALAETDLFGRGGDG